MSRCRECGHEVEFAARVTVHVMYDCHLFDRITARNAAGIIQAWKDFNAVPHPARFADGSETGDLGKAFLCPAIVLDADGKQLRRVGRMVFPESKTLDADLRAYERALRDDPDITRLLYATEEP